MTPTLQRAIVRESRRRGLPVWAFLLLVMTEGER